MMKKVLLSIMSLFVFCAINAQQTGIFSKFDYSALNEQAMQEYLQPVHQGGVNGQPFWNVFSKRFIYAPAFDFESVKGAQSYHFVLTSEKDGKVYSFDAESPQTSLAPIWQEVKPGKVELVITAVDKKGKTIKEVGRRSFVRDFPFIGPYSGPARSYRESAMMGAHFVHHMKVVQEWLVNSEPNMSFENYTYACKMIGSLVRMECLVAKLMPDYYDDALKIARQAADCLIRNAQPADAPLAYFPPTYYLEPEAKDGWPHHVYEINQGKTMLLEAVYVADAYLDLYELTHEQKYLDLARGIANTYKKLQNGDGSWPIKIELATGITVDNSNCTPTPILFLAERLKDSYGDTSYDEMVKKAEAWVDNMLVSTFNITGQFEDQKMENIKPYENLTHCPANEYARYLLGKKNPTQKEIDTAIELIRFSEDQFIHWDAFYGDHGFKVEPTPCVHEQYFYETPVDASSGGMAGAFLLAYKRTGNLLDLAKAKALLDEVTQVQIAFNGRIPTTWEFNNVMTEGERTYWINCSYAVIVELLNMADLIGE